MLRNLNLVLLVIIAIEAGILGWQSSNEPKISDAAFEQLSIKSINTIKNPQFVEDYWSETDLKKEDVLSLLDEQNCLKTKRDYYACASAVSTVAERLGYKVDPKGSLIKQKTLHLSLNEKELLSPWIQSYEEHRIKNSYVSVKQIWELLEKVMTDKSKNLYRALAINAYLSIKKDPHTYILPKKMYAEVVAKADNKTLSLGLVIGKDKGTYFIRKILKGSLAEQAGLQINDIILSINEVDVKNKNAQQISELLKGESGSTVEIQYLRGEISHKVNIIRKENIIPTVVSSLLESDKKIGLISLNKFSKDSCFLVKKHIQNLNKRNIEGLIFDLRDNSGGQLDEASCILSLLIDRKTPFFKLKYFDKKKSDETYAVKKQKIYTGKLAVLVNRSSASAAEIVAGVIQDLNRGIIVGEKTFGKGTFQEGYLWPGNMKIIEFKTMGYFVLPSGRAVQLTGVKPDIKIEAKGIFNSREEETYMYPIAIEQKVYGLSSKKSIRARVSRLKTTCLPKEENILRNYGFGDDSQMLKAQSYIGCEG